MTILTLPLPRPATDTRAFDQAADHLAGAAAIVAWGAAAPRGLFVHTVSLLSATPPRILFAVGKQEAGHDALLLEQECGVSLLAGDDQQQAERFTRGGTQDRFDADRWTFSADAPPRLTGALAHFSGFIDQKIDAGSHSLFVVRVGVAAVRHQGPLVYFDGAFHRLQGAPVTAMIEA